MYLLDLYITKRTLHIRKKAQCTDVDGGDAKKPCISKKEPIITQKRPISHSCKGALQIGLYVRLHIHQSLVYLEVLLQGP